MEMRISAIIPVIAKETVVTKFAFLLNETWL